MFSIATLVSVLSLFAKLGLYIKQTRKRRADADPVWLATKANFSSHQLKVRRLKDKLMDTSKVPAF